MSLEQLKTFLEKVKEDSSLQDKLKMANSPDEVIGIAKEQGCEFTTDSLNELSEKELEVILGGWRCSVGPQTNKQNWTQALCCQKGQI